VRCTPRGRTGCTLVRDQPARRRGWIEVHPRTNHWWVSLARRAARTTSVDRRRRTMASSSSLSFSVVRDSIPARESGIRRAPRELGGSVAELLPLAEELAANLATLSSSAGDS